MQIIARNGDTWNYYSELFLIPLPLILDSNQCSFDQVLVQGQNVSIPGFVLEPLWLVKGFTLWNVASMYNLTIDALILVNPEINLTDDHSGNWIKVPKRVVNASLNGQTNYHFRQLQSDLKQLKQIYPFISIDTIGQSVEGLPIEEITLGRGALHIHMNASFHANEWITSGILMQLLDTYLLALTNHSCIRGVDPLKLYEGVTLSIVPMVNPDGVNLVLNGPSEESKDDVLLINKGSTDFTSWKANIRGVDLNNQFPAKWEIEKERKIPKTPAPRDFPGNAPLSEPEAFAMAALAKDRKFNRMLAFHTQGEEFYWGYEGDEPAISSALAVEFERVSGYKAVRYIDSHAGYKDWYIQEFKGAGFTIELGKGINPLPLSSFKDVYAKALGIFLAVMYY